MWRTITCHSNNVFVSVIKNVIYFLVCFYLVQRPVFVYLVQRPVCRRARPSRGSLGIFCQSGTLSWGSQTNYTVQRFVETKLIQWPVTFKDSSVTGDPRVPQWYDKKSVPEKETTKKKFKTKISSIKVRLTWPSKYIQNLTAWYQIYQICLVNICKGTVFLFVFGLFLDYFIA